MKSAAHVIAGIALLLGLHAYALAHAFVDRAVPGAGASVHGSPAEVSIRFTEELEPAFSTLRVLNRSGREVDKADGHVDRGDPTLLRVSLPRLPPGTYRVVWRALSVDTHVTEGDYTFEIAP